MKLSLKKKINLLDQKQRLYQIDIPLIGLTGGIASGKSSVSQILKEKQIPLICADLLIKKIYKKKTSRDFIEELYPDAITPISKEINFPLLRRWAFSLPINKKRLESFLYPQLEKEFLDEVEKIKKDSSPEILVYDIPLLFENHLEAHFDLTICVYTTKELQVERLTLRDNIDSDFALDLIENQMSLEEKKEKADLTFENASSLKNLKIEVDHLF